MPPRSSNAITALLAFAVIIGTTSGPVHADEELSSPTPSQIPTPTPLEVTPSPTPIANGGVKVSLQPFSLTLSGGSSLGAYQGGVTHTLATYAQRHRVQLDALTGLPTREQPKATSITGQVYSLEGVAGTSAGAANTVVAGLAWCSAEDDTLSFRDNSVWEIFMPVSVEELLPANPAYYSPDDALLAAKPLEGGMNSAEYRMRNIQIHPSCQLPLGITLTRSVPATIQVGESLTISTSQYVAPFELSAAEDGHLLVDNHTIPPGDLIARQLTMPSPQGTVDIVNVVKAVRGSAAIPAVFNAQLINHCVGPEEVPKGESYLNAPGCPLDRPFLRQDSFVDGGAFSRIPLGLTVEFVDERKHMWVDMEKSRHQYITIDPFHVRVETQETQETTASAQGIMGLLSFTSDFVMVARQAELQNLFQKRRLENDEEVLVELNRGFPVFGRYIGNFGAFMDTGFLQYDYFTGIYEAVSYLATEAYRFRRNEGLREDLPPLPEISGFDCANSELSPYGRPSTETLVCSMPYFTTIGTELGLHHDWEISGLLSSLLRWELRRALGPEQAEELMSQYKQWPFTHNSIWPQSRLNLLVQALESMDHGRGNEQLPVNFTAFSDLIKQLSATGYPFETEALRRNPEVYLQRLARRALARLEYMEREDMKSEGSEKTLGQRVSLNAIRAASAAIPAPPAPRKTLERKRSGAEVLIPNYVDFNLLQGGMNIGYETQLVTYKAMGYSISCEPFTWQRGYGVGWQATIEGGWIHPGLNRISALRMGPFVQGNYAADEPLDLGLRVSGRFLANRIQVGIEVPIMPIGPQTSDQSWPNSIEIAVGIVDVRGVVRLKSNRRSSGFRGDEWLPYAPYEEGEDPYLDSALLE